MSCLQSRMMCWHLNLSLLCTLCGITHVRIVLLDMLDYQCLCCLNLMPLSCLAFSWFNARVDWNRGPQILDRILFSLCSCILSWFASILFCCMSWSFSGWRWMLTCMQHTTRLTRMQYTKHYSHASYYHAAHEVLLACSTQNIIHVQYTKVDSRATHFMSHMCFD